MKLFIILWCILAAASAAPSPTVMPQAAKALYYNQGTFQGDIKLQDGKAALGYALWPGGIIPYVFASHVSTPDQNTILIGMSEIEERTCIRFIPRISEEFFINITTQNGGCISYVGMAHGFPEGQEVSIGDGCMFHGTIIHELMHAIGFWHEQTRNDRDDYVHINFENIQEGMEYNFEKDEYFVYAGEGYNYESIMHYGRYGFSVDWGNLETIVALDPNVILTEPYEKDHMTQSDANQINNYYAGVCSSKM